MLFILFAPFVAPVSSFAPWHCAVAFWWMWCQLQMLMPVMSPMPTAPAQTPPIRRRRAAAPTKPHWRSKPEATRKHVLYLAIHRKLSSRKIEDHLKRLTGDPQVNAGKSWVAEFLAAHIEQIKEQRRAMRRRLPKYVEVGHTWAMDLTFLVNTQGLSFAMLGILDHGSRRLLCLKELPRKCTLTLLGHLFLTMARFGVPSVIRTDNESMFASALWQAVFAALGICHRRSKLGCPWQNGRIERLFGTLKPLLRAVMPTTSKALRALLAEFTWFYNHVRVHQNLKGLTPIEAWNGRTLADVRQAHARGRGRWVEVMQGQLMGFYVRC